MTKFLIAYSMSSFFFGLFGVSWDSVDRKIQSEYPDISYMSTSELQQHYQFGENQLPVIVDVREIEEFQVSHLHNALNLITSDEIASTVSDKDAAIVVYCSVGYRSAGIAQQLQQLGYTNVRNLRHSIFEWAENGYELSNALGDTEKVHPFNRAWGSLVDSQLHSYTP